MLVLTRKPNESIQIGDDITVTYLESRGRGKQVRIGIEAPKHISIIRTEIESREHVNQPENR